MRTLKNQFLVIWIMGVFVYAGCGHVYKSPRTVVPGDRVTLTYTCRTPDNDVIATVDEKTATNANVSKSPVFMRPESFGPVSVIADAYASTDIKDPFGGFEGLISAKIAEKVIGLRKKETVTMMIEAGAFDHMKPADRFLSVARVRTRSKEKAMSVDRFLRFSKKKPPVAGMSVILEPGFRGEVRDVREDRVYMDVHAQSDRLDTFMGRASITDKGDHYDVRVDAEPGDIVRLANMVGVISKITEDRVEMDFGHPFGGVPLACEVSVRDVEAVEMPDSEAAMAQMGKALLNAQAHGMTDVTIDLSEDPETVQEGDLVEVSVDVHDETGRLLFSTREEEVPGIVADSPISDDPSVLRSAGKPLRFLLGIDTPVAGIETAVAGMKPGTTHSITVSPLKAYGPVNPSDITRFPRTKETPRRISMTAEKFIERAGTFPVLNHTVALNPYFDGKVVETSEEKVVVEFLAEDGKVVSDELGKTTIHVLDDKITLTLSPKEGALFQMEKRIGRVVDSDDRTFSVDFNHPLAGKPLTFDVSVRSLIKASTLRSRTIDWIEDFDFGQTLAKDSDKPMVLVLYASWCTWSHKFLDEVMTDSRIKVIEDRFVWVRVDSDKETMLKEMFDQESFPTIVVIGSGGEIIKKLKGFRTADTFRNELIRCLDNRPDTHA